MNLWAKRAGLLLSAAVLIFFISCEDDSFLLGFKGKTKFKGRYQELVFDGDKSSVLLLDSVYTDQYAVSAPPINQSAYRFLIGEYTDPEFGNVRAEVFAGFLPNDLSGSPTKLTSPASLDSVTLQLLFDYYAYGPEITINEEVLVYELNDTLSFFTRYFNHSTVPYKTEPVGRLKIKKLTNGIPQPITLTQLKYEEQLDRSPSARDTLVLHGRLNLDGGEDILSFEERLYFHLVSQGDSVLIGKYIPAFRKAYPGFAFISAQSGRLLGFNTIGYNSLAPLSRVTIHYSSTSTDSLRTSLYFSPGAAIYANAFNTITTQRTGGLSGISTPNEPFTPSITNERYIQDGTPVITELDLSDYYSFIDTLEDIVINSAELSIDVKTPPVGMTPIPTLYAMLMKQEGSKVLPLDMSVDADSIKMIKFAGNVFTDLDNFVISTELSGQSPLTLTYDKSTNRYAGFATLFFQRMFDTKDLPEYTLERIGLFPSTAPILKYISNRSDAIPRLKSGVGNSVNRTVLSASGIKLKLYYTVPNKANLE